MESPDQPALLIMDRFRRQMSTAVQSNLDENKILVVTVPAGTIDTLQPLDITVNKAAKDFRFPPVPKIVSTSGMPRKL